MDAKDRELLTLLSANAREPTASLARKLGLSRSTVQARMERLERDGVIAGYTVREADAFLERQITAHVMLSADPKRAGEVINALKKMPEIQALHAISGQYDYIAMVRAPTTMEIDQVLDRLGSVSGVERTMSSIVLSTKFER